ncbi:hypothetical protein MQX03_11635, partial [Chryseobacterium aahli]|uniref:hypothetical protein n=1 Tax=Chryseobacterium aahli TaxID=1278643 RepID=UPI00374CF358|nr:hypothetical protein [Chryseobacterium aahli]
GELKLTMNNETGKVKATAVKGKTLSAKSQKLLDATTDSSIQVQIAATDDKLTKSKSPNIGVFENAIVGSTEVDGKKAVTTNQSLNPEALKKMDDNYNKPGATTLHEILESYIAGLMVQKSGISSGSSGTAGSIYNDAHKEAETIATTKLPDLPSGKTISDVEVTIHSHLTEAEVVQGKIYSGDATIPGPLDPSTFSQYKTNIIVGPLGPATGVEVFDSMTRQTNVRIDKMPNGIVIYNGSYREPLKLEDKAVKRILEK